MLTRTLPEIFLYEVVKEILSQNQLDVRLSYLKIAPRLDMAFTLQSSRFMSLSQKYFLCCGGLTAAFVASVAEADVIYFDEGFTANLCPTSEIVHWDIDGNGEDEFHFWNSYHSGGTLNFNRFTLLNLASRDSSGQLLNGRGFIAPTHGGKTMQGLESSFQIGQTLDHYAWGLSGQRERRLAFYTFTSTTYGSWKSYGSNEALFEGFAGDTGIIGFRFEIEGQTHYGWAEVRPRDYEFFIDRWAYESESGKAIAAGAIPEASSLALLSFGAVGLATFRKRRMSR